MESSYFKNLRKAIEIFTSTLLFHLEAIKLKKEQEEPFEYTSGKKGPIYINNRVLISHPYYKKIISGFFATIIEFEISEKISCIIGGATAGMSFAEQLADLLNKPYFYIKKKEKKPHGLKQYIVGDLSLLKGNVILVEDLITDGGSKEHFLDEIEKYINIKCNHCLVVFDREQGGKEKLEKRGVSLHSLTTLKKTLQIGLDSNFIDESTYHYVSKYLKDPEKWASDKGYV
ncbi:MAG: orotate phosphoribosyltransferase [Candidatus Helarchaeota archaeon]